MFNPNIISSSGYFICWNCNPAHSPWTFHHEPRDKIRLGRSMTNGRFLLINYIGGGSLITAKSYKSPFPNQPKFPVWLTGNIWTG